MNTKNNHISHERKTELAQRFNEPKSNYELLREDLQKQSDRLSALDRLDTNGILQKYVTLTDKLIAHIDGSVPDHTALSIADPRDPERSSLKKDTVIFLDKSARPVSWLVDALWEQSTDADTPKPDYDFLNIDRVNWFMDQGYSRKDAQDILGPNDFDIDKVDEEDIARIRAYFTTGELSADAWSEQVWDMPTRLDGKNVLVVDEAKSQGGTLSIATQLIRKAVPEALVSGQYFWESTYTQVNGLPKADSMPVWYDRDDPMGRGIGDTSMQYHEFMYRQDPSQENLRRNIAARALSAPHFDKQDLTDTGKLTIIEDLKAKRLLQDIAFLTYAVGSGTVQRRPYRERDIDEIFDILEKQGLTIKESSLWANESKRIAHQAKIPQS